MLNATQTVAEFPVSAGGHMFRTILRPRRRCTVFYDANNPVGTIYLWVEPAREITRQPYIMWRIVHQFELAVIKAAHPRVYGANTNSRKRHNLREWLINSRPYYLEIDPSHLTPAECDAIVMHEFTYERNS